MCIHATSEHTHALTLISVLNIPCARSGSHHNALHSSSQMTLDFIRPLLAHCVQW